MKVDEEKLLSVTDLSAFFGVRATTIWGWIRRNQFPQGLRLTPRAHARWRLSDVLTYVEEQHNKAQNK